MPIWVAGVGMAMVSVSLILIHRKAVGKERPRENWTLGHHRRYLYVIRGIVEHVVPVD